MTKLVIHTSGDACVLIAIISKFIFLLMVLMTEERIQCKTSYSYKNSYIQWAKNCDVM